MYAAAGGASCRNARKRQALQIVKDKAAIQKALEDKLAAERAAEMSKPPKSKQFHQLPPNYLRQPQAYGRKLSVGYTGHSGKLLLPISEQSGQRHSPSQLTLHEHQRHPCHYTNEPRTPTFGHRGLEVEHKKLSKSATASFPLSQAGSPPGSPSVGFRHHQHFFKQSQSNLLSAHHPIHIQIPTSDGIIITPATPLPSPTPSKLLEQRENEDEMPEFPLERTCSIYRNRRLLAEETTVDLGDEQYQQQFYPSGMPNGNGHHTHWADEFGEPDEMLDYTCDHVEVKL